MPDEKPNLAFGSLADLLGDLPTPPTAQRNAFEQYVIRDRVYRDSEISLDGYRFVNCAFINCTLRTSKGSFHMDRCFIHLCTVLPRGNAARIIALTAVFVGTWAELPPGLSPKIEPDGSITIP